MSFLSQGFGQQFVEDKVQELYLQLQDSAVIAVSGSTCTIDCGETIQAVRGILYVNDTAGTITPVVVANRSFTGEIITCTLPLTPGGPSGPDLGTAASYAVIGGNAVTGSAGPSGSTLIGNLGESPGSTTSNFPPSTVSGSTHLGDGTALTAANSAYAIFLAGQTAGMGGTTIASELNGQTLTPGNYKFSSSGGLGLTGTGNQTLTFNGHGTYYIYSPSTLTTGASAGTAVPVMTLTNGALASDIFWIVGSSATINQNAASATANFKGTVLAAVSITIASGGAGGTVTGSMFTVGPSAAAVTTANDVTITATGTPPPSPPVPFGPNDAVEVYWVANSPFNQ